MKEISMLPIILFFSLLFSTAHSTNTPFPSQQEQVWIIRQFESGLYFNDPEKIAMMFECMNTDFKEKLLNLLIECNTSTFLHYTVRYNLYELSELLLEHGAQVNAKDFYGQTPLQVAAHYLHNLDMFKLLLAYGADIDTQDFYHKDTILHSIIKRILGKEYKEYDRLLPIITFLLQSFPDIKLTNREGKSVFSLASHIPLNPQCQIKHTQNGFTCSCKFSEVMQNLYLKKFGIEEEKPATRIRQRKIKKEYHPTPEHKNRHPRRMMRSWPRK